MTSNEAFTILEIPLNASNDEAKKAFHRLAHKHHPDKGGDAEKFKKISEAYAIVQKTPRYKGNSYDDFYESASKGTTYDESVFDTFYRNYGKSYKTYTDTTCAAYEEFQEKMREHMRNADEEINKQKNYYEYLIKLKELELEVEILKEKLKRQYGIL